MWKSRLPDRFCMPPPNWLKLENERRYSIGSIEHLPRSQPTAPMMASRCIAERQPGSSPAVNIPPRVTAVPGPTANSAPRERDQHLQMIKGKGCTGRQKAVAYGKRALVKIAIYWCN